MATRNRYAGVYVADTMALAPQWTLVLSGRYNAARIATQDRTRRRPGHQRHQHVSPLQSGRRRDLDSGAGDSTSSAA